MTGRGGAFQVAVLAIAIHSAFAQSGNQSRVASDFMREGQELQPCKTFTFGSVASCAQTLVTGQPVHIALGSLAPQNGFAAGVAFVEHKDFSDEWRLTWNADAVATGNGSWRAGAYMKAFRLGGHKIVPVFPGAGSPPPKTAPFFHVAPLYNLYAETTSLNRVYFYGLGPNSVPAAQAAFGLTQTVAGVSAIVPLGRAGISLYGELNGRIPRLRGDHAESVPSIEQIYSETSAPGLARQPDFLQPGEGIRIQPSLFKEHLRLHYFLEFQNFIALSDSHYNFRRWTTDLGHEFPFDSKVHLTAANDQNGPDSCTSDPNTKCPSPTHVSSTLNHEGSVNIRLLMTGSAANAQSVVPFYFDPTIGGSDLNGQPLLPSYPDYRFRAPNLLLLRATIEHSIPKIPLGAYFSLDEAKVGLRRDDINFDNLRHTFTAGLTVHAGGLPVVYFLFSWGGNEGHHTAFSVSNVLLGASSRPSLF
jgi:hypothetical protein